MIMEDLTDVFNYILKQTVHFYIERKNYLENIDRTERVPKNITKQEIHRAYLSSLYAMIEELQLNELYINEKVVLSDDVEQTSKELFNNIIYPQMKSALNNQGVTVINNE